MLYLRIIRGAGREEQLSIAESELPFTIGRDQENNLYIKGTAVSRFHAVVLFERGQYYVQDMESTNGTFLNGKKAKKSRLHPGDKITVANVDIIVDSSAKPLHSGAAPLDLTVSVDNPIASEQTIAVKNPTAQLLIDPVEKTGGPDLSRSYSALQVLYRADTVLRHIDDFKQLLESFMDLIAEVIPATRAYIFLINKDTGLPVPYVRRSPQAVANDTEIIVSRTILQTAVEQKESILSRDALVDERFAHSRSVADLEIRSAICAPLINRKKVLGIIYLDSVEKNRYSKDDLSLLSAMAFKAGIAMDNARLYDDLRDMFFNTIETLVRAIQARDEYTSGHSARVSRYSLLIADRLGLNNKERQQLYLTAMLHDIGKIGVPDDLLNRPGKLEPHEIEKVRDHVSMGASMLNPLGEMKHIVPLILHHHEAWDGSGYPDGLKGEAIPLISRIVAVADTYDAMTSNRSYREARSKPDAIAELKRCAGKHYDPKVVKVFLQMLEDTPTAEVEAREEMPIT